MIVIFPIVVNNNGFEVQTIDNLFKQFCLKKINK